MILLSSIAKHHIVLNCPCGHVGMVTIANLIEVYSDDVNVDAVGWATLCRRCRSKRINDIQIIYVGSSGDARHSTGQAHSDNKF